jgi:hypothetical protein
VSCSKTLAERPLTSHFQLGFVLDPDRSTAKKCFLGNFLNTFSTLTHVTSHRDVLHLVEDNPCSAHRRYSPERVAFMQVAFALFDHFQSRIRPMFLRELCGLCK